MGVGVGGIDTRAVPPLFFKTNYNRIGFLNRHENVKIPSLRENKSLSMVLVHNFKDIFGLYSETKA